MSLNHVFKRDVLSLNLFYSIFYNTFIVLLVINTLSFIVIKFQQVLSQEIKDNARSLFTHTKSIHSF